MLYVKGYEIREHGRHTVCKKACVTLELNEHKFVSLGYNVKQTKSPLRLVINLVLS